MNERGGDANGRGAVPEKTSEPPPSKVEALDGSNYEEWSGRMRSAFKRYKLLKIAVGEEKMPEEGEERERWIEKSTVLFDLILQSVNNEMFEHIKDLVEADDSGPRAWKLLRDVIQPNTLPMVIVLEKELAAISMRPGDDVKLILDKIKDTYARMAAAGSNLLDEVKPPGKIKYVAAASGALLPVIGVGNAKVKGANGELKLVKNGSLKGLEVKGEVKEIGSCPTCLETKFSKFPFNSTTGPAKTPLALRECGHKVKVIRSDNGGEFIGADFEGELKRKGIQHQLTVPYNPQQNGVAERFNRTLQEGARTLLGRAGLPDPFWVSALRQVALVKNRVLATVGDKEWIPYIKWYGSAPAVNMLRAFGCMVVFHVPKEKRGKLEASGRWGVHLGIAKDHKGWLLWDLTTQKLTVSRDVKFLESLYYKEWKQQQQKLPSTPLIVEADEVQQPSRQVEVAVSEEEMSGVTEEGGAAEVEEQQQQQHESPPRVPHPPERPRRDVRPPVRLTYGGRGKPNVVQAGSVVEQIEEDEIALCYWAAIPQPKVLTLASTQ
ncbi:hypothetical protein CLOM_g6082 [Closterium sp. NIES-68]|nr:hypothetical protein CLOM_g6082 [Closterium sp. NIES-68]